MASSCIVLYVVLIISIIIIIVVTTACSPPTTLWMNVHFMSQYQWLKCHKTQGTPFPHLQFLAQSVPHLTFPKKTGERYGGRYALHRMWANVVAHWLTVRRHFTTQISSELKKNLKLNACLPNIAWGPTLKTRAHNRKQGVHIWMYSSPTSNCPL